MRLKFTYLRPGGIATDLVAEVDAQATVGQLAAHIVQADPHRSSSSPNAAVDLEAVTLALDGVRGRVLDRGQLLADSPLVSGVVVTLAQESLTYAQSQTDNRAARLRVVAGPDLGRDFALPVGSAVIGREEGCEVRLTDPMVSRRHARLTVGETVEIVDQGSVNGLMVGLAVVQRATVSSTDLVTVGDTQFEVTLTRQAARAQGTVRFIRPAQVPPAYEGKEFIAPVPPERRQPQRFPTIALVTPLIMGGVLFLTTHQLASIIFVALSPMMLIGNAIESRIVTRREFKRAVEAFDSELQALVTDVRAELSEEITTRLREHPAGSECAAAALERGNLMWIRRPDLNGFAELRLGIGRSASRCSVERPTGGRAPYDLTRRLASAIEELAHVDGVPVVGCLGVGAVGVAGPRVAMLASARAIIAQVVVLHSPAEVVVVGAFASDVAADWDWLKWLPHTSSPQSPVAGRHIVGAPDDAATLIGELEALIDVRRRDADTGDRSRNLPAIVVVVESGAPVGHNRLVELAERGPAHGVHVLWFAVDRALLPATCKTFLLLGQGSVGVATTDGLVGYVVEGQEIHPVAVDTLEPATVETLARALSPVEDLGARNEDDSDLPRTISQFAALGDTTLATRAESVIERWQASNSIVTGRYAPPELPKKAGSLRAVVGMTADGPHTLDLRTDGPHALVGGSTNSGKSELLQSWILSLAATHSPERVTFLLVDYKGGSAFADCEDLPHTIGLVTDLGPHMVRRALTSLKAELRYREHLLQDHDAKDLVEMENHGLAGAPPSLVIVVDEFAALIDEVPEFIEEVVNVAARGRSLGLHLILATQQPSGVIRGSLRANTNLRLALRVTDAADSQDVIGSTDAAAFDPQVPGRAMSRSGPKRLVAFQAAYSGGWTSDEPEPPQLLVEELSLTAPFTWNLLEGEGVAKDRNATDIKRLVARICEANAMARIPEPRKAWLGVLKPTIDISKLSRSSRDDELVFGVADDPDNQDQPTVAFRPDREGNLAVFGTGGTGKSTLLRSLAVAAAFSQLRGPCHIYALDFGNRALQMLEVLPHVGSVVPGSDHERVTRLIQWLRDVIDERAVRYGVENASSITEYRSRTSRFEEPRILLLVDNIGAFRQSYEAGSDRQRYVDLLTSIANDGRQVGVHLVVSASERVAIHTTLSSSIQRRLVMRMSSEDDYGMLGVPADILDARSYPGRAIDGKLEIQVGILGLEQGDASQAGRLRNMAAALRAAGALEAPPIRKLATRIQLGELIISNSVPQGEVPLGVESTSLEAVGLSPRGGFLLTGPPGSGRTTALRTIVTSLVARMPAAELHYFGHRRSSLTAQPVWSSVSLTVDDVARQAQELADGLLAGDPGGRRVVVVVESAGDLVMTTAETALQALVKACIAEDHWFVAEGEVSTVRSSSGFLGLVRSSRRGLALQPDQETGGSLFNTAFPRVSRADFPEGRGFAVGAGRATVVQVAMAPKMG